MIVVVINLILIMIVIGINVILIMILIAVNVILIMAVIIINSIIIIMIDVIIMVYWCAIINYHALHSSWFMAVSMSLSPSDCY